MDDTNLQRLVGATSQEVDEATPKVQVAAWLFSGVKVSHNGKVDGEGVLRGHEERR